MLDLILNGISVTSVKNIGDPKFKPVWVESQQKHTVLSLDKIPLLGSGRVACLQNMFHLTPT